MEKNKYLSKGISKIFIGIIRCYQYALSPLLGSRCRFYPSCSAYAIEALTSFGFIKGSYLTSKRILCCHPWHKGGFDPVPRREKKC